MKRYIWARQPLPFRSMQEVIEDIELDRHHAMVVKRYEADWTEGERKFAEANANYVIIEHGRP